MLIFEYVTEYIKHITIAKINKMNVSLIKKMSMSLRNFTFVILNIDFFPSKL